MTAPVQIIDEAIESSKARNEIVFLRDSEIGRRGERVIDLLLAECAGTTEAESNRGNRLVETWGEDLDGNEWRVHVEMD